MSNAKEITDTTFKSEVLDSAVPVLVDFWAPWCGPCRMMTPVIDELGSKLGSRVKVVKLNVDKNPSSSAKYGITAIPCLIIFKNGKEADRIVGFAPADVIEKKLTSLL